MSKKVVKEFKKIEIIQYNIVIIKEVRMKKNAFTLIELIAVIVILSIVLTLSVPSLIGALKNNKEKCY